LPGTPEAQARQEIDRLLEAAGWHVCDAKAVNLHAARGVAIREFELTAGHGTADYLPYVDGNAAGLIWAKKGGCRALVFEVHNRPLPEGSSCRPCRVAHMILARPIGSLFPQSGEYMRDAKHRRRCVFTAPALPLPTSEPDRRSIV